MKAGLQAIAAQNHCPYFPASLCSQRVCKKRKNKHRKVVLPSTAARRVKCCPLLAVALAYELLGVMRATAPNAKSTKTAFHKVRFM